MPRGARKKGESGIYHIILRGHNRQIIFEDDEDHEKFLHTINNFKIKSGYRIYGYCLMGNHIHLLLHELNEEMGTIMRRIGASYVYWYNWKYKRCGHLFQDRYKSEAVETDAYLLTVLRYIHQNPVKAGIVKNISGYKWSSYNDYINNFAWITDIGFALDILNEDREKGIQKFIKYHQIPEEAKCLEIEASLRLTDEEAQEIIKEKCCITSSLRLKEFEKAKKDRFIKELKEEGLSTRQIERLTGISRGAILKT
ncbi:MAG: transposase [Desulfotomaculaceae bacterium]|nr:transposase [Desulfotomaculaceae bacterium]